MMQAPVPTRATLLVLLLGSFLALGAAPIARAAEVSIVQPSEKETIHNNLGNVTVKVAYSGGAPGDRVRLILDGRALRHAYRGKVIKLRGIDRGAHTLQAELLDANGAVLATSESVSFYLWHASRLYPQRRH